MAPARDAASLAEDRDRIYASALAGAADAEMRTGVSAAAVTLVRTAVAGSARAGVAEDVVRMWLRRTMELSETPGVRLVPTCV